MKHRVKNTGSTRYYPEHDDETDGKVTRRCRETASVRNKEKELAQKERERQVGHLYAYGGGDGTIGGTA